MVARYDYLKQILINLIKNACEAMAGKGGNLQIETHDYLYQQGKEFIEIVITDSGAGIPPQIMAALFQPVASTKGGSHSGLGLSIVRSLVDELQGSISCRSSEQRGTRFQLLLPRELKL